MHVSALSLTDFRSWPQLDLELGPGPTALVGSNGQGKTNVVEALLYVATLGSHRVSSDAPLVRQGAERAVVRARVERDGREMVRDSVEGHPQEADALGRELAHKLIGHGADRILAALDHA